MSNPFKQLGRLLPGRPLQVGQVIATAGDVSTVLLPGGGTLRARGAATVGASVYVRDGVIEGTAPSLTVIEIEV